MTDNQHTKGEWVIERQNFLHIRVYGKDRQTMTTIADVYPHNEEVEANAKIIAAAPNMLEALERINHTLHAHGKVDSGTPLHDFIEQVILKATI